jgi:hypothetical protein
VKIEQSRWNEPAGWTPGMPGNLADAHLVLAFGGTEILRDKVPLAALRRAYPRALIVGCSTAGEILDTQVYDNSLVVTAVAFERTRVSGHCALLSSLEKSYEVGERLARSIDANGLTHVFVLSEGVHVNGSDLVRGLTAHLPASVRVTGGLSGDGDRFKETLVVWNDSVAPSSVAVIAFHGASLRVGYGSLGGWDPFGPERVITRSRGNVLFELDGKSALTLYKRYLGEHAAGLPATGLLFPLALRTRDNDSGVVRTILSVNESDQSMTFAGDVPEGAYARLMKANFNRLVDGAAGAAKTSHEALGSSAPDLAVLISCVGRRMVLKQRVEEEVEAVRDVFGQRTVLTGFYSYGEISPFTPNARCELHNQTMTITTFAEG